MIEFVHLMMILFHAVQAGELNFEKQNEQPGEELEKLIEIHEEIIELNMTEFETYVYDPYTYHLIDRR